MRRLLFSAALMIPCAAEAQTIPALQRPITMTQEQSAFAGKADVNSGILNSPTLNNPIITGTLSANLVPSAGNVPPAYVPGSTVGLNSGLGYIPQTDKAVWVSSSLNFSQFSATTTANILATGRATFSVSNNTLATNASNLNALQGAVSAFAGTSGSFGLLKDAVLTPGLPQYRMPVSGGSATVSVSAGVALVAGHTEIDLNGQVIATDNGAGQLSGSGGSGTVNYNTGAISFTFTSAPAASAEIWAGFWLQAGFGSQTIPSSWWTVWDQSGANDQSPSQLKTLGYAPTLALVNMNGCGQAASAYCMMAPTDLSTVLAGVQAAIPSVKKALPYISPNGSTLGNFVSDAYWSSARAAAIQQGGFAIDMPVGFFQWNSAAYRAIVAQMIQWAHQNNLVVVCELSAGNPVTGQANDYLADAKTVVSWLMDNNALPNVWYVDQYAFNVSPGTDDTTSASYSTNSVLAVARWITDNVPTVAFPSAQRGMQSGGYILSGPAVSNGNASPRATVGTLSSSLGSMAFQPSGNVNIVGGSGAFNTLSVVGTANLVFGSSLSHFAFIGADGNGNVNFNIGGGMLNDLGGFSAGGQQNNSFVVTVGGQTQAINLAYDMNLGVPTVSTPCSAGQVAHGKGSDGSYHEYFCYATNQWAMSPAYSTSGF